MIGLTKKKSVGLKLIIWIGYKIAFETKEQIRFMQFGFPLRARIEAYQQLGKGQPEVYVLVDSQYALVKRALEALNYSYQHTVKSNYHIVYNLKSLNHLGDVYEIEIPDIELISTHNQDSIGNILDNDLTTRWGSAQPQSEDMSIRIKFPEVQELGGFYFDLAQWETDYPRSLVIKLVDETGKISKLLSQREYRAISFYWNDNRHGDFYFPQKKVSEIILEQKGSDPFFDWSIAEIGFYQ